MMRNICDSTMHEHTSIPTAPAHREHGQGQMSGNRPLCTQSVLICRLYSGGSPMPLDHAVTLQSHC